MEFSAELKKAMQKLGLNQAQVAGMTGCSKGAVSQYLSGRNIPPEDKRRGIAVSLGLAPDYFDREDTEAAAFPREAVKRGAVRGLLVSDAAKMLGMNANTVRKGLQQGVFPWGYAVRTSANRWVYFINAKRFAEIEGVAVQQ